MIPTRGEIQDKLDEIRDNPNFSTLKVDLVKDFTAWLDSLDMPETITIAGEEKNPKEQILDDLGSYGI